MTEALQVHPARDRASEEIPLRAELLSGERLEQHARSLAEWHKVDRRRGRDRLLSRLTENEQVLEETQTLIAQAVKLERRITPAAEWLLDNFYLVEEQIRLARRHLPPQYSRQLPRLAAGPAKGYPRVYDIALELISHVDGQVDSENLRAFIGAYQSKVSLTLGELWAVPIMLRLALIENLRRVATRIAGGRRDRENANDWADRLIDMAERDPRNVVLVLADMVRVTPSLSSPFVAELTRRMQGQGPALQIPVAWVEARLAESGLTLGEIVQQVSQSQAGDQASMGNSVGSLRFLAATDWRDFVEAMSGVEAILRSDPAGVYARMDFRTRNEYRQAIERLARRSDQTEDAIARAAISLAKEGKSADGGTAHVGSFLVDDSRGGLTLLEREIGARTDVSMSVDRWILRHPIGPYLGAIATVALAATMALLYASASRGVPARGLELLAVPALLVASQLAVSITNWWISLVVPPRRLPRLALKDGVPDDLRTLVVVPTLLHDPANVAALLEGLEIRCLANRDPNLGFALLTDFADAENETEPADKELLDLAASGIRDLNARHLPHRPYFLLHRPRRWNARERRWMGWERKRGKLADLNALLRGDGENRFSEIVGDVDYLEHVRFVITLDTDTSLPRDSARELIGTLGHPLNQPVYEPRLGRIAEGYGIIQPRVGPSITSAARSRFAQLFAGEPGIDPYTRAVSDVYQDAFGEGSFIGKGIYDVDAFEKALGQRFPENRILSHDLVEGTYARAGLATDVVLYEEEPSSYFADVSRRQRWIRGDWQIAAWLFPKVPGPTHRIANPLSLLSRWKIFDNLRRSVMPAAELALLALASWLGVPMLAVAAVAGAHLVPPVLHFFSSIVRGAPPEIPLPVHARHAARSTRGPIVQGFFSLACLPYEALYATAAIVRTWFRLAITRRRLLEWTTAGEAERSVRTTVRGFYRTMWANPAAGIVALVLEPHPAVVALALAWLVSPAIAWWISRPLDAVGPRLADRERVLLRSVARRTYAYFERFTTADDHWLPPDNYQEAPSEQLARRTSPTNIGLGLLSELCAYDLGYQSHGRFVERVASTLETLDRLDRYEGHFLNWYDTATLRPLGSHYVSTVDSGNLVACLLVLAAGADEMIQDPIARPALFDGIRDALRVLDEELGKASSARLDPIRSALAEPPITASGAQELLRELERTTAEIEEALRGDPATSQPVLWWASALHGQVAEALGDQRRLAPWVDIPAPENASAELRRLLDDVPTLARIAELDGELREHVEADRAWVAAITDASRAARERIEALTSLAARCRRFAEEPSYDFLYDKSRRLLTIGFNATDRRRDGSYYDLLASEARVASFIAVAQGKLPKEHWFALSRLVTAHDGELALVSWSGSMFEYLMPELLLPCVRGTLIGETVQTVIDRQIAYGDELGIPWGVSESCFAITDAHQTYQYRAFGVPGLGLMRGLADDRVVAPYATLLSLPFAPDAAASNVERLIGMGMLGAYGFYEAIDFTPARMPRGEDQVIVRTFMAHHHGMSLVALTNALGSFAMTRRFLSHPEMRATEQLLHERVPKVAPIYPHPAEVAGTVRATASDAETLRTFTTPHTTFPEVQLLSNGRLHVMVTAAGGGYVRWKDLAVTRWHEDATRDGWGPACYVRDVSSERVWSVTHQPALATSAAYEAVFLEGRAEFRRSDEDVHTQLEIGVSPEDDVEVRRVRLTNRGRTRRTLEVTSYLEVVLAPPTSDAVHPAFSNLFVETEILRARSAILATRRKRAPSERPPWLVHRVTTRTADEGASYETNRAAFIGRNRSLVDPEALHRRVLSGQEGAVLDPCAAIRHTIVLGADETATIDFVTGIAETRDAALALCDKYESKRLTDRVLELSWTHAHVTLRELDATDAEAQLYGRLAGAILYANPLRRSPSSLIARNRRGQSGLWGYGISGDLPIVLLRLGDPHRLQLLRELVRAHAWWRLKGLAVDLVIWNEDQSGYRQALHDEIVAIVSAGPEAHVLDRTGGIFVRRADQISDEDKLLLQSISRVVLADSEGTLAEQLDSRGRGERRQIPRFIPTGSRPAAPPVAATSQGPELLLFNGLGGFSKDGREYVIELPPGVSTPLPWSNVIANPFGGTVVTESGSAYTWAENAHELRLTPWYNDPIQDASGEAFYLRDDESGQAWSPCPFPARAAHTYTIRHGFGYSVFQLEEAGIRSELTVFVARDAPVKLFVVRIENRSGRTRGLSVFGMVEWVLGDQRSRCASQVVTEIDAATGAILARNPLNHEFPRRTAFFDVSERTRTVTGSRTEFVGRNETLARPEAMRRVRLSNRVGAGLDPCGAIQVAIELEDGADREITFVLGAGKDLDEARGHLARYRGAHVTARSLAEVMHQWRRLTGAIQVETPDPTLDALVNGWLPYQVQGARIWGRSGYYQSGGAYGFRDQLQDVLALLHNDPHIAREQIVRAARHQFAEGDVQHWWHPPIGRGVRTRISDDYLWLPYATAVYVEHTADSALLDEVVPLLAGRPLNPDEESYYDLPVRSEESCSIYEHCVRAIRHGLRFGEHGLPLIGSGDWNDGMNLVGIEGKGESVWLGFFLADVLRRFAVLAEGRADVEMVELCERTIESLRQAIETHAWDGAWYRRATFDDGTPLGTATAEECRIDCLPQSWAVLTGLVDPERARQAMQSVDEHLVRRDARIVQLLTPPFDRSSHNPGYIQGYVPGVRENGGQYTHAAVWTAMAFAALGDRERAWELFTMLNPLSGRDVQTYKVEPYVLAADVYANPQHVGRGGWTWYTGAAGWMLRFVLESLLGIRRKGKVLTFAPLFPEGWTRFRVHYRFEETLHHITVENRGGREATRLTVDGVAQRTAALELLSDGAEHEVVVECGPAVV